MNLSSVLEDERIFALVSSHKSESFNSTPASPSPQTLLALRLDRSGSSKARCLSAVDSSWCSLCPGWVWRARMSHAKPRNRLELESRASSLSTYRDELQAVIQFVRSRDFGVATNFKNFRD